MILRIKSITCKNIYFKTKKGVRNNCNKYDKSKRRWLRSCVRSDVFVERFQKMSQFVQHSHGKAGQNSENHGAAILSHGVARRRH